MKDEVSPIQIIKGTLKNNCGDCGFNTCMAFATAVVRRTASYTKCPYLEVDNQTEKLLKSLFENEKRERLPGINALTNLEKKLKEIDFKKACERLGLNYVEKDNGIIIAINYLGEIVELLKKDNKLTLIKKSGENIDIYDKILIYNYVYFSGDKGLSNEWVGMESLPNSISKVKALEKGALKPFRDYFTNNLELLKKRIKNFPHKFLKESEGCIADLCIIIYVFPKLPIRINFWDATDEEGFEAQVKFLFDKNVLSFLDLESLVFASEKLTEKIIEG